MMTHLRHKKCYIVRFPSFFPFLWGSGMCNNTNVQHVQVFTHQCWCTTPTHWRFIVKNTHTKYKHTRNTCIQVITHTRSPPPHILTRPNPCPHHHPPPHAFSLSAATAAANTATVTSIDMHTRPPAPAAAGGPESACQRGDCIPAAPTHAQRFSTNVCRTWIPHSGRVWGRPEIVGVEVVNVCV